MNEKSEWQFLVDYVKDDTTDFSLDSCRNQLLALLLCSMAALIKST